MSHEATILIPGNHKGPLNWPLFAAVSFCIAFYAGAYALVF